MTWIDNFNSPSHADFDGLPIIADDGRVVYSMTPSANLNFSPVPNTRSTAVVDHEASDSNMVLMTTEAKAASSTISSVTSTNLAIMNDCPQSPTRSVDSALTPFDHPGFSSFMDSDAFATPLLYSNFSALAVITETVEVTQTDESNEFSDKAWRGARLSEAFGSARDRLYSIHSPPTSPHPGAIVQKPRSGTTDIGLNIRLGVYTDSMLTLDVEKDATPVLTPLKFTSSVDLTSTLVTPQNGAPTSTLIPVLAPTTLTSMPILTPKLTFCQKQTLISTPSRPISETTTIPTLEGLAAGKCLYRSGFGAAWTFWQKYQSGDGVVCEQYRRSDDDVEYDAEGFFIYGRL